MKSEDSWDRFFNFSPIQNNIIDKIKKGKRLGDISTVRGSATVKEAYEIKKILIENPNPDINFKRFINTGTIDRYSTTWATDSTQYIRDKYYCPTVNIIQLETLYPTRAYEANLEKIIIAGLSKKLECYFDSGHCLAGKSTIIVYESLFSLKYICAILNSKIISWFYSVYYNSLSMANGFFRIGTSQIKEMPIIISDTVNQRTGNDVYHR